jgi:hypothetical protein
LIYFVKQNIIITKRGVEVLKFGKDGKFTIMQIADIQEIQNVSPDTLKLLNAALDKASPDLAVLTGDQIQGYDKSMRKGDAFVIVKDIIEKITEPLTSRNVPFTVTYGNHDKQSGVENDEQADIYGSLSGCVIGEPQNRFDKGTFSLQIYDSRGEKALFNIYIIDSNGMNRDGYEPISHEQIEWYRNERERIKTKFGEYVPSFVFQHIPIPEVFCGLKKVKRGTKGAIPAFRSHAGQYYKLPDYCSDDDFFREAPAPSDTNNGEFDAFLEKGEVKGVFFGHDHMNSFIVSYKGIDIGYSQGVGFNVYGPGGDRGVRIFELSEDDLNNYKTYTLTYKKLTDGIFTRKAFEFALSYAPMGFIKRIYSKLMVFVE